MNRKQLTILLVLVVVVGGIGLALFNKSSESYSGSTRSDKKLLGDFNVNDVAQIHIKQDDKEVNVVKANDKWTVKERGNYPANFEHVSDLIRKAADLKVVQTMQVGASQRARVGLGDKGEKAATVVEFKGTGGKELKNLQLGGKHMRKSEREDPYGGNEGFPDGRYILTDPKSDQVIVVSETFPNAEPKPENWLNKDFFKVEKVKSISVAAPEATNSWKISRDSESGSFQLADVKAGEKVDTNKLSNLGNSLSYPSFQDVVIDSKPEQTGLDKPTTITVTTFEHFTYTLQVGKLAGENYHLKVSVAADLPKERTAGKDEKAEDKAKLDKEFKDSNQKLEEKLADDKRFENWVYLVPKWNFEQIMKNRAELMEEKKEEKTAESKDGEPAAKVASPELVPSLP